MSEFEKLSLKDPEIAPTSKLLEQTLGESYAVYEAFQEALPSMDIEQEWQWYTPYKAWFAKGQHWWETLRGTRKEKTLYWLHVYEGYFSVAVWFKEKNRMELLSSNVSEKTRALIQSAKTMGKMPTFPVIFNITSSEHFSDIHILLNCKKKLEK